MDKKKYPRFSGYKNNRINIPLGIHDINNNELYSGDEIIMHGYTGRILWSQSDNAYVLAIRDSQWYGDDEYSIESYGKSIPIPLDDGAKMSITLRTRNEEAVCEYCRECDYFLHEYWDCHCQGGIEPCCEFLPKKDSKYKKVEIEVIDNRNDL